VGVYLMASASAGMLSNLLWGQIADRFGNRLLMRLTAASAILPPALALLIPSLVQPGVDASLLFALVFVFQGAHVMADGIGSINYVMEIAPPVERPTYIGLANGVAGVAVLASPLGGALVDLLGFRALFTLSLVCALVAVLLSLRLDEPRERPAVAG